MCCTQFLQYYKQIHSFQSYVYHTLFIDGITYLCATDNGLDSMAPSAFLKKVSDIFTRNPLMSQEHFFPSNALATDFQRILAQHMMEYNTSQRDSNTVSTVKSQVTDVKNILLRNIDTVLEREIETVSIVTEGAEDPQATICSMCQREEPEMESGTGGLLAATAVCDGTCTVDRNCQASS